MRRTTFAICIGLYAVVVSWHGVLQAGEKEEMEAMQKQLNQVVLDRPFNLGDRAAIDAYLQQAIKNNTPPPQTQPPVTWQPGWTCGNLMYSYYQYRNCLHYHQYYGYYYRY